MLSRPRLCPRDEAECTVTLIQIHLLFLLGLPWLCHILRYCVLRKDIDSSESLAAQIDKQLAQPAYGWEDLGCDATIDEYLELALGFAYVMFFSIVLPSTGVLILLRCIFKLY